MEKLKFAFYWAASCGGCEIAVLDINEKILDVVAIADIVFWPVATSNTKTLRQCQTNTSTCAFSTAQ